MENAPKTALALAEYEGLIDARVADYGREMYKKNVQPIADALPRIGVSAEAEGRAAAGGR